MRSKDLYLAALSAMRDCALNWIAEDADDGASMPRQWADALTLAVAAPDMLEALRGCITEDNSYAMRGNVSPQMRRRIATINATAREAIAKATPQGT